MTIFFYKVWEPYGCFSNFSPHSIELEGRIWPTTEHFYQAHKYLGSPDSFLYEQIFQAPTPEAAAALGRNPNYRIRPDWNVVKVEVMYRAVRTKFMTYTALRELLIQTGHEQIVENSPTDDYWGCGCSGTGQNHLGKVLMRVREELRPPDVRKGDR
ncbi:MAG: NADAR family protein [Thermosynechococcaceae cyanobacterium MS004]|nr:NADAR family protein [Thermosynechococcaceae cyanobacterium MS004]